MAGASIRIEGVEKLVAGLTRLEKMARVQAALEEGARFVQGKLKEYPKLKSVPNRVLYGNSEKSRRARAGFFGKHIGVPYRRTGDLGRKWTVQMRRGGWEAVIGNNLPYVAAYVQGKQTYQHAMSGWLTVSQASSVYAPRVQYMVRTALEKEVASV
jgi:hypothetical protein